MFIATNLINSNEAAEDILQEVFVKIWLNKEHLSRINNFSAYLRLSVRNEAFDLLRKKARMEVFLENNKKLDIDETPDDAIFQFEERQVKLADAINHLTSQQRKVFELCGLEGRRQSDVARVLHISKATVKKHMADAYKNIREFLRVSAKVLF